MKRPPPIICSLILPVILATIAGMDSAIGIENDGRSFALGAALPELERDENPFFLRQAWWHGELAKGERTVIRHQLFKRNEYWFWIGGSEESSKVAIHIYDSEGNLVENGSWEKGNVAGARFKPEESSSFFIVIEMKEAAVSPAEWAVVYAYR